MSPIQPNPSADTFIAAAPDPSVRNFSKTAAEPSFFFSGNFPDSEAGALLMQNAAPDIAAYFMKLRLPISREPYFIFFSFRPSHLRANFSMRPSDRKYMIMPKNCLKTPLLGNLGAHSQETLGNAKSCREGFARKSPRANAKAPVGAHPAVRRLRAAERGRGVRRSGICGIWRNRCKLGGCRIRRTWARNGACIRRLPP